MKATAPPLLPQPRSLNPLDGPPLAVRSARLSDVPAALDALRVCADETLAGLEGHDAGTDADIRVVTDGALARHAYRLVVDQSGIRLTAGDSHGLLYGVQTLAQLWTVTNGELPRIDIHDAPTFPVRGIFAESTRGSDLMSYTDWCSFVDQLASLRYTHLGIAVYGCWDLRHDADRSEFLFVPLDAHPELRTTRRLRTWDPVVREETVRQVTPLMFQGDFFVDVVCYARTRGIDVIPSFAGPSHSTLVARTYPETSARDENDVPTGYGYCLSRTDSRARLLDLFANLIDQHLRPAEITLLGVGGDEYYPIRNLDPSDPLREVSPWCRCEDCADLTAGDQLLSYYGLIGPMLAEAGIRMVLWHDSLSDLEVLSDFADWARMDLQSPPVVSWWRYSDPLPDVHPAGLETWVSPTTGLIPSLAWEDFSLNIESWLRRGYSAGATGVYAYNTPDPVNHKNYACLADLSWNLEGSGGAAGFKRRWCEIVAPSNPEGAALAYAIGEQILGDHSAVTFLLDHLLAYFSTAPYGVVDFPDDVLAVLVRPSPAFSSLLRRWAASLRRSGAELPATRALSPWPDPQALWRGETGRLADHLELVANVVDVARLDPAERLIHIDELVEQGVAMLRRIADSRVGYQAPYVLREHWYFVAGIAAALEGGIDRRVPASYAPWQAWQF